MPKTNVTLETIESLPTAEVCAEISTFLAEFARNGGLPEPLPGDDQPAVWEERLSWWWHSNPFVKEAQPLAYLLRNDDDGGKIVGFHGFIPHDYEANGKIVPTLIATTFFVEEAFRSHSMKIVLKLNKLGREFQLLDGTPSPEMRAILDKFQFEKRSELSRFNILVKRGGFAKLKAFLIEKIGFAKSIRPPKSSDLQIVNDPEAVVSIPEKADQNLRRCVTKSGLSWMAKAGNGERHFFGLIDENGALQAYAIGLLKKARGLTACRMLEYGAFDDDDSTLVSLMSRIAHHPKPCGLPKNVDVILWSVFDGTLKTVPDFEPEIRESTLYFKLPSQWQDRSKTCLPCEGDLVLL